MQLITGHTSGRRKHSEDSLYLFLPLPTQAMTTSSALPAAATLPVLLFFLQSLDLSHTNRGPSCNFTFRLPETAAPGRSKSNFGQHHLQFISSGVSYSPGEPSSQGWLLLGDSFKGRDSSSHTIISLSFLKRSGPRASVLQDTMYFSFPCKESL